MSKDCGCDDPKDSADYLVGVKKNDLWYFIT